jgi:hypothetical protein
MTTDAIAHPKRPTLSRSVDPSPPALVEVLAAIQTKPADDPPSTSVSDPSPCRFVHQPADAATVLWNQVGEAEWHAAPAAIEATPRELCPRVFCDPPSPLAIGVHHTLFALLAGEFAQADIARFLREWVRESAYRDALAAPGAMRLDLDGIRCGLVAQDSTERTSAGEP